MFHDMYERVLLDLIDWIKWHGMVWYGICVAFARPLHGLCMAFGWHGIRMAWRAGTRAGTDVAMLFAIPPRRLVGSGAGAPRQHLLGYERVHLR